MQFHFAFPSNVLILLTGFIYSRPQIQSRTFFGSMMPNWLQFHITNLIQKEQFLTKIGFKLHINFISGMRLNFWVIGFLCFKSRFKEISFDSCFDDADRSCKNSINARAILARATLKELARNLLNILGVAATNKP